MNWTKTPPTRPGAYWHRWEDDAPIPQHITLVEVENHDGILWDISADLPVKQVGGEWCGPLVPVEEVRRAYYEGHIHAISSDPEADPQELSWPNSRARRVVEGNEI